MVDVHLLKNANLEAGENPTVDFTDADRQILLSMMPVIDALANFLGNNCEVLIHSLEDLSSSIIGIRNGHITGRSLGNPITDFGMKLYRQALVSDLSITECYESKTKDRKILRSITTIIRNGKKPIGLLCINLDVSAPLHTYSDLFFNLCDQQVNPAHEQESFVVSIEELIQNSINRAMQEILPQREISPGNKNRQVVTDLKEQGIFEIKGAIDIVAKELGVSKYTVYHYLRNIK